MSLENCISFQIWFCSHSGFLCFFFHPALFFLSVIYSQTSLHTHRHRATLLLHHFMVGNEKNISGSPDLGKVGKQHRGKETSFKLKVSFSSFNLTCSISILVKVTENKRTNKKIHVALWKGRRISQVLSPPFVCSVFPLEGGMHQQHRRAPGRCSLLSPPEA